jgi:hypothetical protein
VLYFLAFYAQLLNVSGTFVMPEGTYVLAAALRWGTVAALVWLVVRDVLHPERDVVRATYSDDPDGGDFDGAPDDGLLLSDPESRRRWWARLTGESVTAGGTASPRAPSRG